MARTIYRRRHIEDGLQPAGYVPGAGKRIASNYMDIAMVMDYWSDAGLNHHTEATTMLYGARECARIFVQEGLPQTYARHAAASRAVVAGVQGMNLKPPVKKAEAAKSPKSAGRRKSFCGRMCGMKAKNTSSKTARDPNSRINKSLRAWDCSCK